MTTPQPDNETSEETKTAADGNGNAETIFGGRYSSLSKIGSGGMGAVYRAEDTVLKKVVALKVLLPNLQAEAMIRFHNEAKTTAKLSHPNILNVLDFGLSETGEPYLVMDFLDGKSLADLLKDCGPIEPSVAIPIFCQICVGLGHAHSLGVLHRDIKPSNVMLVSDDHGFMNVKIVDFGLAKMERAEQSLTTTGARVGSPLYMSPEQCNGLKVDHRSDIYSLGILMYKTLIGVVPFQGDSFLDTLSKHVHEEPKDINENEQHLQFAPELNAIVSKTLEKDPDQRFQSCEELRQALLALELASREQSRDDEPAALTPVATACDTIEKKSRGKALFLWLALTGLCFAGGGFVFIRFEDLNKHDVIQPKAFESHSGVSDAARVDVFREDENSWIVPYLPFDDRGMEWFQKEFPKYKHISFVNTNVTGAKLSPFIRRRIESLDLSNTYVDDGVLATIARMKTLEGLWLNADMITDAGISHLKGLAELKELGLRSTLITNEGLNTVRLLPALEILDISNCDNLTSKALAIIKQMPSLKILQIAKCKNIPASDILKFQSESGIRVITDVLPMHARRRGWEDRMFLKRREKRDMNEVSYPDDEVDEAQFERKHRHHHDWHHHNDKHDFEVRNQSWKDYHDPEVRKFFAVPKNWDLSKEEAKKLKNPIIRKYFEDPRFNSLLKDPEIREHWQNPDAQSELDGMENTIKKLIGPDDSQIN